MQQQSKKSRENKENQETSKKSKQNMHRTAYKYFGPKNRLHDSN